MTGKPVHRAVLPAAGLGTRLLPATKAQPKEMLPVVDRPTIQYVVEECARAGLDDLLLVTGAGKESMEDHFDRRPELEAVLRDKGKLDALAEIQRIAELATIHSVRQHEARGLGHAVLQAREHVGGEPFAVLLGDDLIDPADPLLERMIAAHEDSGRPVVALMEVPDEDVPMYGIADAEEADEPDRFHITGLVEKPGVGAAPSNLAVIGRYVLPPGIFDVLADTPPGKGGEIQLTDALETVAAREPAVGVRLRAPRHDAGDRLGYLKATVSVAAQRDDLGADFLDWLEEFVADHRG